MPFLGLGIPSTLNINVAHLTKQQWSNYSVFSYDAEIRTYHLPDDEWLSYGRWLDSEDNKITYGCLAGYYIVIIIRMN